MKIASAFQRRHHQADFCYIYQVAEGEKMNFKNPPKMSMESLPVPMGDWDPDVVFDCQYGSSDSEEIVSEEVSHPSEWHAKAKTRSSGIPSTMLASPVKKRTFDDLFSANSPIKVEPGSSSVRSPLFTSSKK